MLNATVLLGAVGSVCYVLVNFITNLANKQHSAVLKQAIAWLAGALVTFAAGATQLANKAPVFHSVGALGQALLGIGASSFAGVIYHGLQRVDPHDPGSVVPAILKPPAAPAPVAPAAAPPTT